MLDFVDEIVEGYTLEPEMVMAMNFLRFQTTLKFIQ